MTFCRSVHLLTKSAEGALGFAHGMTLKNFDWLQPLQHVGSIQWPCAPLQLDIFQNVSMTEFSLNRVGQNRSSQVPLATKLHCGFLILPFRATDLLRLPPLDFCNAWRQRKRQRKRRWRFPASMRCTCQLWVSSAVWRNWGIHLSSKRNPISIVGMIYHIAHSKSFPLSSLVFVPFVHDHWCVKVISVISTNKKSARNYDMESDVDGLSSSYVWKCKMGQSKDVARQLLLSFVELSAKFREHIRKTCVQRLDAGSCVLEVQQPGHLCESCCCLDFWWQLMFFALAQGRLPCFVPTMRLAWRWWWWWWWWCDWRSDSFEGSHLFEIYKMKLGAIPTRATMAASKHSKSQQ